MRARSATLVANEIARGEALVKCVLTRSGEDTKTYEIDRIPEIKHTEEPYRQAALITLLNDDGEFTGLDLSAYQVVVSYGYTDATQGDEYSACAPLRVMAQHTHDFEGRLVCTLALAGIPNFLAEEKASAAFAPGHGYVSTVKDIINFVMHPSTGYSFFQRYKDYTPVFDLEDSLIDVYTPREYFRIYKNESRLDVMRKLLSWTKCAMRFEDDGEPHIFVPKKVEDSNTWAASTGYSLGDIVAPTAPNNYYYVCTTAGTSGGTEPATWSTTIGGTVSDGSVTWTVAYDAEWTVEVNDPNFYNKTYRRGLIVPGKINIASNDESGDGYSGSAEVSGFGSLPDAVAFQRFYEYYLASNAQADAIAEARISKLETDAERGSAMVEMNVGSEVYDLVNCISSRASDRREGTLGSITRHWRAGSEESDPLFEMEIRFGGVSLGGNVGTMPSQAITSTMDYKENITRLWDAIDGIWAFLDQMVAFMEQQAALIEPLLPTETPLPADTILWQDVFDGGSDSPTAVDWAIETGLPFTPISPGTIYFSSIIEEIPNVYVVYVIDASNTEFWKYSLTDKEWTKLASPTYTAQNCYRTLAINPLGTKLACVSEGASSYPIGRRIEIYTIGTDTWAASAQTPAISGSTVGSLVSLVWADNDTIWAWARRGSVNDGKCIKYVVSTDTWTVYTNLTGVVTSWQGRCASINDAGTVVYGGQIGVVGAYHKYTIATDTYSTITNAGYTFAWAYDKDKLWFIHNTTYRQGYIDTADDSVNASIFPENAFGINVYHYQGISDDLANIISRHSSTAPELSSIIAGGTYQLGADLVLGNWTAVHIEKPDDNFPVLVINEADNVTLSFDHTVQTTLWAGTWKFYYPQTGDYTQVVIRHGVG